MKFGLVGQSLPHSFSAQIHSFIGSYPYELREVAKEDFASFMEARDFIGINVTIPYKEEVIPYLHGLSGIAKRIGAVNVVMNHGGRLYGYNTDYAGLRALIRRTGVDLRGKTVLILGTGGTSRTAYAAAEDEGAKTIVKVSSSGKPGAISYEEAYAQYANAEILINTTPVGMFPDTSRRPADVSSFENLQAVIDVVYNPLRTELVLSAKSRGAAAQGGLYMLVSQAVRAAEIFTGAPVPPYRAEEIFGRVLASRENTVLIGMPSCGKTTVGRALAQKLGKVFYDTDGEISRLYGKSPAEIIENDGIAAFRHIESETVARLAGKTGAVIATGGGTVLDENNVKALRRNGRIVLIDRPLEELCCTPDRPLSSDREKLEKLYADRRDVYLSSCDCRVNGGGSVKQVTERVEKMILEALSFGSAKEVNT